MCGIFAAVNNKTVTAELLSGLSSLSYRGYDSAGIAVVKDGQLSRARCEGKLQNLTAQLSAAPIDGSIGIAHTRWATHGLPTEKNAHPHMTQRVAVVHNGIVENANELRHFLEQHGHRFESETDSENIAQLITYYLERGSNFEQAIHKCLKRVEGSYSIVVLFRDDSEHLYAAKHASPLVVGQGKSGYYVSSDENALGDLADQFMHLEDSDIIKINHSGIDIRSLSGADVERIFHKTTQAKDSGNKGSYQHYMLKEINEQPAVYERAKKHNFDRLQHDEDNLKLAIPLAQVSRLTIVACGTSYFAGMVAKQWFEQTAGVPVDLEIASEYRYRGAPVVGNSVAIFISQSGETADTLAALRHARSLGQASIALVNVINSSMAHEADVVIPTLAGPEIGVASTKAFTAQLTSLLSIAVAFAKANLRINRQQQRELAKAMQGFSKLLSAATEIDANLTEIAEYLAKHKSCLFLGRAAACALAEEGALKLKEISYIHAEAYAAGELKHGPLALVDENMPVIMIAPPDALFAKTLSNLREVASRGGKVILISNKEGMQQAGDYAYKSIVMAETHPLLQPLLYTLPLQLIAYQTAVIKGNDVDQPRNLAKSVTVE
ncbi:glutamine--fructose-6-phosphate transaminase (isomerizing) [Agaribacterium haliotis]|uniref:glutamine--fructose-6-phosphate transaminase (isomerizing) n=1 Tax=Agaribacterium haliotis TaxID=2013869 RepID=UPI000BB59DF6|nr:glutamine--fructose-6-phosphate transaminase (isomerizing) [Agaribacterium haliotis]